MKKKIFNTFNWIVFLAFVTALCSLNAASWAPTIVTVITGAYLILLGEAKGFFTAGATNVHKG
jgi:hypothetical protein